MSMLDFLTPQHRLHLEMIEPYSLFLEADQYQLLTFKVLSFSTAGLIEKYTSFIFGNDRPVSVDHSAQTQTFYSNDTEVMKYIKALLDQEIELFGSFSSEVDRLEDLLYERRHARTFLGEWFKLKKNLLHIDRAISRRLSIFRDLLINPRHVNTKDGRHLLQELTAKSDSQGRNVTHLIQRLDAARLVYESIKQDRLNTNIYLLALVSSIFLPMNLIVGFFGINTENLYFDGNPNGTHYVLMLLLTVFITLVISLPLARFLDQIFLRRLLSKSGLYQRMARKIQSSKI
jgi:magnesium transporter